MKVVNGTSYNPETSDEIIGIIERLRESQTRITLEYGDIKTGQGWGDIYDVTGTIGRSFGGTQKIPLLIHNRRSTGGGGILTHCIVSIIAAKGKKVIYNHPTYKTGRVTTNQA